MASNSLGRLRIASDGIGWPIHGPIDRIGDSVTPSRPGSGRPHRGIDLFVPAGTEVFSAAAGHVKKIKDGRFATGEHTRRAGLYIDIEGAGGIIYRYLHLGSVFVAVGSQVGRGTRIGEVAPPYTSGAAVPHLHFEMRLGYDSSSTDSYGKPLAPDKFLPRRTV